MRKVVVWIVVLVVVLSPTVAATASPKLPTNDCIEQLMEQGFSYKRARLVCSQRQ